MQNRRFRYVLASFLCVMGCFARYASAASDRRFSLSFSGGMGYLADTEWFRDLQGQDLKLAGQALGVISPHLAVVRDGYGFERVWPEFTLEAAYRLTSRFSLGLGAGYVSRKWMLAGRFERRTFIPEDTANFDFSHEYRLAYFPVYLCAVYEAFQTRTSTFGAQAAVSFDILKLDHVDERADTYFSRVDGQYKQYGETVTQDGAGAHALGMRAGIFGERRLTEALATFITVEFRLSPVGEVFGSSVRSATLKSNDKLIYDTREVRTRESVQPGHSFVMTGPVVRGGIKVRF